MILPTPPHAGVKLSTVNDDAQQQRISQPAILFGLIAATVVCYGPVLGHDFVNIDDHTFVLTNPFVRSGLTGPSIAWAFGLDPPAGWTPLAWMSHMVDCMLFDVVPAGHHLTNLLLHVVNVLLAYVVLRQLTGARWRSAAVAALLAVHPLHVESVAWIAERRDVLFMCFSWLTIGAYGKYVRQRSVRLYLLVALGYTLAIMSKPMAVTLPAVMVLLDFWPLSRLRLSTIIEKAPLLPIAALSTVMTALGQANLHAFTSLETLPVFDRVGWAVTSYGIYLYKTIVPLRLAVFYPKPAELPIMITALSAAALIIITILAVRTRKSRPYLLVGWLWYVGTLIPVSGLFQTGLQAMADRYMYLPLIGIYIAVVWGAADGAQRFTIPPRYVIAMAGLIFAPLIVRTSQHVRVWRNTFTLCEHALAVTDDNYFIHHAIGRAYSSMEGAENQRRAQWHFETAVQINEDYAAAQFHLGEIYFNQKHYGAAAYRFKQAASRRWFDPTTLFYFGLSWSKLERWDHAITVLEEARKYAPDWPAVHYELGRAYQAVGRTDEARRSYRKTLELEPRFPSVATRLEALTQPTPPPD